MNTLQSAKYALVKAQLKAMSFDWADSPNYSRNGESVYEAEEVVYSPNANTYWTLVLKASGILCLTHGDQSITIDFLSEYNTQEHFIISLAEKIHKVAQEKIKNN